MSSNALLSSELSAKLQVLQPGTCCVHRSWGIGQIKRWEQETDRLIIDFLGKPGHAMDFTYAAQSLQPLSAQHIESRLFQALETVQDLAKKKSDELVHIFVESYQHEATVERLEKILVGRVIPAPDWKKWWETAKKALKKDPRWYLPTKRNEPILFHDQPAEQEEQLLDQVREAVGPEAVTKAIAKLVKLWKSSYPAQEAQEVIALANKALIHTPKSQLVRSLELMLARDEFAQASNLPEEKGPLALDQLLPTEPAPLLRLLEHLPAVKQAQCLQRFAKIYPEKWPNLFLALIPQSTPKMMETIVDCFRTAARLPELYTVVERCIRERSLNPDLLVWICKNRDGVMSEVINPQLFSAILLALEYDQLADYKRGTKLHDLIVNDKDLVRDLLATARHDEVRDITRAVLLTPVFQELNKRSLLATFVKLYPFVQAMIIGDNKNEERQLLIVSWESLERRKKELEELISKKIPENTREISVARSYGDLRENHEFKAAKEMQTILMRRKAELEHMLTIAQGTDFTDAPTDQVNVGTVVTLVDPETKKSETYTILGAWDSDPGKGTISYLTSVAKALMTKQIGDEVSLPLDHGGSRRMKIQSIQPYIQPRK